MTFDRCCRGLLTLAVFGLYSCTGSEVTPPHRDPAGAVSLRADAAAGASEGQQRFVRCNRVPPAGAAADIGPRGGRISAAGNRLIVPSGALQETVHITLTVPGDGHAFIALAPTGLVFQKQARLVFNVRGCDLRSAEDSDLGTLSAVYVDDEGRLVEWLPARRDVVHQTVSTAIRHFSGYALAW